MAVHLLSDFEPEALSIVGKGANRKVWFLRKEAEGETLIDAPGPERLLKARAWNVAYCVVAEPGWHEEPGVGGDQEVMDRWASDDEIAKAAHAFQRSGGLINKMHESLEPYGTLVENAVALADFEVDGQTIKKGSWYVGIEPDEHGWEAIDKGEFTGVSIQGRAVRTLVEKRDVGAKERRRLASEGKALPDGSFPIATKADLKNAISAYGRAADKAKAKRHIIGRARALGEVAMLPESWNVKKGSSGDGRSLGVVEEGLLKRIAKKLGISDEELAEIEKGQLTFAARMAERDLDEELPQAMDVLRSTIWGAFYPAPTEENPRDPKELIGQSLDEFKAWALDLLDRVPAADVAKQIEKAGESTPQVPTVESMSESEDLKGRIEAVEKKLGELEIPTADSIAEAIAKRQEEAEKAPTVEDLNEAVAKLSTGLEQVAADVKKLGEGGSAQSPDGDGSAEVEKSAEVLYAEGILG